MKIQKNIKRRKIHQPARVFGTEMVSLLMNIVMASLQKSWYVSGGPVKTQIVVV